jgi:hypothetical protein
MLPPFCEGVVRLQRVERIRVKVVWPAVMIAYEGGWSD